MANIYEALFDTTTMTSTFAGTIIAANDVHKDEEHDDIIVSIPRLQP